MKKNQLDNMSGQELKEMIEKDAIALEQLDNSALEKIMSYETDMLCLGNGDMMTIRRCAMLLNDREDDDTLTKDDFISIIDKAEKEHITIVNEKEQLPKAKTIKKHIAFRRGSLVAAVLAVTIIASSLASCAFGFNFFRYLYDIVRNDEGSKITVDGFTFYHNGESKQYSSIEEMMEQENLDVMYPAELPQNITIDGVRIDYQINGKKTVRFLTNDVDVLVDIELDSVDIDTKNTNFEEYNGVRYYFPKENPVFAFCYVDGNKYYISADTRENLIFIIENMKELNQ